MLKGFMLCVLKNAGFILINVNYNLVNSTLGTFTKRSNKKHVRNIYLTTLYHVANANPLMASLCLYKMD